MNYFVQSDDPGAVCAEREHGHLVEYLARRVGRAPPLADELGRVLLA